MLGREVPLFPGPRERLGLVGLGGREIGGVLMLTGSKVGLWAVVIVTTGEVEEDDGEMEQESARFGG
jgi:hypothetical protein